MIHLLAARLLVHGWQRVWEGRGNGGEWDGRRCTCTAASVRLQRRSSSRLQPPGCRSCTALAPQMPTTTFGRPSSSRESEGALELRRMPGVALGRSSPNSCCTWGDSVSRCVARTRRTISVWLCECTRVTVAASSSVAPAGGASDAWPVGAQSMPEEVWACACSSHPPGSSAQQEAGRRQVGAFGGGNGALLTAAPRRWRATTVGRRVLGAHPEAASASQPSLGGPLRGKAAHCCATCYALQNNGSASRSLQRNHPARAFGTDAGVGDAACKRCR